MTKATASGAGTPSALRGVSAVDGGGGAGGEVRRRRGEEDSDAGEVGGLAPAAGRRAREDALVQALELNARAAGEGGIDPARQHRVHLDVVLRPGASERLGELHDARLARGVGGKV